MNLTLALTFVSLVLAADPAAGAPKRARGSAEEAEQFRRHLLPSEREPKPSDSMSAEKPMASRFSVLAAAPQPQAPAPAAKPAPLPQAQDGSAPPASRGEFIAEYDLPADAEVSVSILAPDGATIRQFAIPPGAEGGRKGKNRLPYWDGRDASGAPAPAGEYVAAQTIVYPATDAAVPQTETRILLLPAATR